MLQIQMSQYKIDCQQVEKKIQSINSLTDLQSTAVFLTNLDGPHTYMCHILLRFLVVFYWNFVRYLP